MTLSVNGNDIGQAIEIALAVGGVLVLLVGALIFYLLVRPPRRARVEARPGEEALDAEELIALIDRMERRLEVLERALPAEAREEKQLLEAGADDVRRGRNQ